MGNVRRCVYCEKELTGRKLKYCNEHCKYRYLSVKNDKPRKRSVAQDLRIIRANRNIRKKDVRYI